jgi:drug/metabolite transporter (DMT)-like permease
VVAVLLGIVVLNETLALRQIAGGLIVLAGVGLVTGALRWPRSRPATSRQQG